MSRTYWFACLLSVVLIAATATQVAAEDADFIIRVTYEGPLALHEVEVLLYDTYGDCTEVVEDPKEEPSEDKPWASLTILPDPDGNIPDRGIYVPVGIEFHYAVARGVPSDGVGGGADYFATFGCTDEIAPRDPSQATVIEIDMHNLWPEVEGTYRIEQRMDPLDRPPWHVRFAANSVKEFINDPGVGVLRLLAIADGGERYWESRPWRRFFSCEGYDTYRGVDHCTEVYPTKSGRRLAELLRQHMDANLAAYWSVREASVREALRSARDAVLAPTSIGLGGVLLITSDADRSGYLGDNNLVVFNQVTWRWEAGERTIELRSESFLRGTSIAASIVFHPAYAETYSLAVARYQVGLSYGELLVWALESVVLPEALSVANFEHFFAELLVCEALPRALTQPCWLLSETAGDALSIWSTTPVPEIVSWATWGTPADDPCRMSLVPGWQDFRVQTLGGPTNRCTWNGELTFLPGPALVPFDAQWSSERL